jgi:hypothetical protein
MPKPGTSPKPETRITRAGDCGADFQVCRIAGFKTCALGLDPDAAELQMGDATCLETSATSVFRPSDFGLPISPAP